MWNNGILGQEPYQLLSLDLYMPNPITIAHNDFLQKNHNNP